MTKNVYVFKNEDEWFKFSLKEWFTFLLQGNRELPKNKQIFRFPRIPTDDDQVWKETPGVFVITFGSDEYETRHVSVQGWSEAEWRSEKESVGGEFKSSFAKCIVCNDDKLKRHFFKPYRDGAYREHSKWALCEAGHEWYPALYHS